MQLWFPDIVNRISNAGNSSSSTVCDILDNSESENSTEIEDMVNCLFFCLLFKLIIWYMYFVAALLRSHIKQDIYR